MANKRLTPSIACFRLKMHPHNFITPANITIWSFADLIAVGTFLLILPQSVNGPALTPVDALFTATSATCVTGLVVVDTGSHLSLFGQWVVLVLIQIDGLGFMTLSTVIILSLGGKFSLLGRRAFQETFTLGPDTRLPTLIRDVVKFTLEESVCSSLATVQTTLYDLIEAVSEAVQTEEEQLVAEVVSHLNKNGRSDIWVNEENLSLNPS